MSADRTCAKITVQSFCAGSFSVLQSLKRHAPMSRLKRRVLSEMDKYPEIVEALQKAGEDEKSPAGNRYVKLNLRAARKIAEQFSLPLKKVEILALENEIIPERYQRNLGTTDGTGGQISLLNSRAAVIGLGGLGGLAAELLARMGTGTLVLVDGDSFSESNLNRQIISTEKSLGKRKALQAAERIKEINSAVETVAVDEYIKLENAEKILAGCQVVLDCLDNLPARFLLQDSCRKLGIPMIHGAIAQFYGQISTIFPEDPGIESIYGIYKKGKDKGIERELGNPAATPAIVAAWQVQEAVKLLLGKKPLLRNCLFFIDTLTCSCETIPLFAQSGKGE